MTRGARRVLLLASPLVVAVLFYVAAQDYFEAAAFVIRAAGMQGVSRQAAAFEAEPLTEGSVQVPWRGGLLDGRTYVPADISGHAVLLVPGVHAAGVDEPRLINFAREIAAAGLPVATVTLPDLARYEITPRSTDMIEDAAGWIERDWSGRLGLDDRRVGVMGISFGGGLAVVAASRLGDRAAWVLSIGGHGDLPRTLRYLCTGQQPDGRTRPPHDYGVAVILLGVAHRVVPDEQVEPLRHAIRTFLEASHLDMVDKQKAAHEFARARELTAALPEPARTFMTWVNDRDVAHLGPALLPHVSALGGDPALSAERNPPPRAPVHLLHGADDNVIPASESEALAANLRGRGAHVDVLVTPLITHAEVDRPPAFGEIWNLIRFWAAPL